MPDKPMKINPDDPEPGHPPFTDLIINEQSHELLSALLEVTSVFGLYLRWEGRGYVHAEPTIHGDMAYFSIRNNSRRGRVTAFRVRCDSDLVDDLKTNVLVEMVGYIYDADVAGIGLHVTWINRKANQKQLSVLTTRNEFERLCELLSKPSSKKKGPAVDSKSESGVK